MSKKTYKTVFLKVRCCTKCTWFSPPIFWNGFPTPPRVICPKCGSDNEEVSGQYEIEEEFGIFGSKGKKILAFIRKEYTEFREKS